jgi:hypothetical protein
MRRLFLVLVGVLATFPACGEDEDPPSPATTVPTPSTTGASNTTNPSSTQADTTVPPSITVPDMVGQDLQLAQDTMQAAGLFYLSSHDATGAARLQVLDRNWKVCTQTPPAGSNVAPSQEVDFGVVRDEEECP